MTILKRGSTGAIVERLQDTIDAPVDGTFSPATERALKKWQKANGFDATGEAGPDQQHEMGLSDAITLEPGDEGELVRLLQDNLGLAQSGVFDKAAAEAVAAWQRAHRLQPTGVAEPSTLAAMRFFAEGDDAAAPSPPRPVAAPAAATPGRSTSPIMEPAAGPQPGAVAGSRGGIASWAYQLYDIDPRKIAALDVDLVVLDYSRDGDDAGAFSAREVAAMRQRPGGGQKRIVSYMSIGEAESYRYYWQQAWETPEGTPEWLDDENDDWPGNYKVRFWDPGWKSVILGSPTSYLDKIVAAGFDGVYLDIIDAFEYWRDVKPERADADRLMIAFVTEIAAYARARRPGFLIIPQNGESLLADAGYRKTISAQAKEDLYYGLQGDGRANKKGDVQESKGALAPAVADGLPILVVEYLDTEKNQKDARDKLAADGFAAYFGPRKLDDIG